MINKDLVQSRFTKAASSYANHAFAQQQIANTLTELTLPYIPIILPKILEIGCGSGFLTKALSDSIQAKEWVLNDLSPISDTLSQYLDNENFNFIQGDAEVVDFKGEADLIVSSSSIQWFNNLPFFLKKCEALLNENGIIAFSTFLPGNLLEIKSLTGIGLNYLTTRQLLKLFNEANLKVIETKEETIQLYFHSPREVLHHLSKTGVNGISSFRWTSSKIKLFTEQYLKQFTLNDQVSLTYRPFYIIAQKK